MKIIDNFLDQENFDKIQTLMMGQELSWYYLDGKDTEKGILFEHNDSDSEEENRNKFMFFHMFYIGDVPFSPFIEQIKPILEVIKPLSLWRIKANLLTRTSSIVSKAFHVDMIDFENFPEKLKQWTTSIFYVNTNNGYTIFEDGTKVESVANRMITFPGNMKHTGTSCTDEQTRVIINFNYF